MKIKKALCDKFPAVLRQRLINNELELPDTVEFEYAPIYAYRAVKREKGDYSKISRDDFKSYFELGKVPKIRGVGELEKNPNYYGVSLFLDKKIIEQQMKFPNPHKKMASGYVCQEGDPQETNKKTKHICWWLYDDADVTKFNLEE